jgi:hypothetical protein
VRGQLRKPNLIPRKFDGVMSRITTLGGFETPAASQSPGKRKAGEAERVETQGAPTTQPDGTADAIQTGLSGLIRLDIHERRAATRERALHILLDRKSNGTT